MLGLTSFQIHLGFTVFTVLFLAIAARVIYVIIKQVTKNDEETFERRDN